MKDLSLALRLLLVVLFVLAAVSPAAGKEKAIYQTGFHIWRAAAGAFAGWDVSGARLIAGELQLDPATASSSSDPYAPGAYYDRNFYNGGSFYVGEAASPVIGASFPFSEAIASWNAETPPGTWIEVLMRVQLSGRWTKWYNLGVWASDSTTIERHSVKLQGDADGYVSIDTLVLTEKKATPTDFQLKVRLFTTDQAISPAVRLISVATSTTKPKNAELDAGDPARWDSVLPVPECSQMVYPNGNVLCSPTSTSMVIGYWEGDTQPCETRVMPAVDGVYDWVYDGHGNWPFNTAYAASRGLEGHVARFTGLNQAEAWVAAGIPVIASISWSKNDLTGAAVSSSGGHLVVIAGFNDQGDPVVNDPAAATDEEVQRTYIRAEFEKVWLEGSGGAVYLIYPVGWSAPEI